MFRFDIQKPEIREIVYEKEESKETLKGVFFYNLLELERLRRHLGDLDYMICEESDLYELLKLGDRQIATRFGIDKRKQICKRLLPLLINAIFNEYMQKNFLDKWDYFILYDEEKIKDFIAGKINYGKLLERIKKNKPSH